MEMNVYVKDLEEKIELTKHHSFVITRQIGTGIPEEVRVRINEDGTLNINTNHQLKILTLASNNIFIDFSK